MDSIDNDCTVSPPRSTWQYVAEDSMLMAYEGFNAFYIQNLETKEIACMGDGGEYCIDIDDGGEEYIYVGTPLFYAMLEQDIEHNESDFLEAYFG